MEPLQQHRATAGVCAQQLHRSPPAPVLECQRLVLGLVVGKGDLEHRRSPCGANRKDDRAVAVEQRAVRRQRPLVEQLAGHPWQAPDVRRPVGPTGREVEDGGRQRDPDYFLPLSTELPAPSLESAAMKASWGTSTRPTIFIRFLPSFCFSSSLRLRVMSPP